MSAYIVDDMTINAIVTFAIEKRVSFYNPAAKSRTDIDANNAEEIGRMLMDENVRSVAHRYRNRIDAEERNAGASYTFERFATPLTPVEVIKQCNCLDYQSCETDDWEGSLAWRILQAVISKAVHDLPGYDAAPWGLDQAHCAKLTHAGRVKLF